MSTIVASAKRAGARAQKRIERDAELRGKNGQTNGHVRPDLAADERAAQNLSAEDAAYYDSLRAQHFSQEMPGETSTTTPMGIAANDPDALEEEPEEVIAAGRPAPAQVALELLHPHPRNRRCDPQEANKIAESFLELKEQLQPITVRTVGPHWGLPEGHLQIVYGERRFMAAQIAGWESIEAVVRTDIDDALALRLMAEENALRQDLNPIEKAQAIKMLCEPVAEGGAGMTREAAAKVYGLESQSAASNLVRLLELPEVWQERVVTGEVPQTFVRFLVPFAGSPRLIAAIDKEWKADQKYRPWVRREDFEREVRQVVRHNTRTIEPRQTCELSWEVTRNLDYEYRTAHPVRFEVTEDVRRQLDLFEIDGEKGKKHWVATNVALWDKLQLAALKKWIPEHTKKKAAKGGKDTPARKRELTSDEKRQQAATQAKQLAERIAGWRHEWLRQLLAELLDQMHAGELITLRVLTWLTFSPIHNRRPDDEMQKAILIGAGKHGAKASGRGHDGAAVWEALGQVRENVDHLLDCGMAAVRALLLAEDKDVRYPTLGHAWVDELAATAAIDVAKQWSQLQQGKELDPRLEAFFLLHQTTQLRALAKELGVHVPETATKAGIIKLLKVKAQTGTFPLPKSVKPIASGEKQTKKARGK